MGFLSVEQAEAYGTSRRGVGEAGAGAERFFFLAAVGRVPSAVTERAGVELAALTA
ncbi:hypothetical protein [Streptomyces rimosus]|uniref:hypothetical protein n=1 Tax=Streptomyces rimosus TaxID=1927 RepID=UPI0037AD170C